VPFHQLSTVAQILVRARYPHKGGGAYAFVDEHYFYPVRKNGQLGRACRVLAIPRAMMDDAATMTALGYTQPAASMVQLVRVVEA
jgi:hypothetical protein